MHRGFSDFLYHSIDAIANKGLVAHWHGTSVLENDICLTPQCVLLSGELELSIDKTVDPCEDFYQCDPVAHFIKMVQDYPLKTITLTMTCF